MKKFINNLTRRQIVWIALGMASFLVFLVLSAVSHSMAGRLETQQMASRWSKKGKVTQVSCFFSTGMAMTPERIMGFEHQLDRALQEASIVSESPNAGARLWADAYSSEGRLAIASSRATAEVKAIGIGGDFFLFHPLYLVSGSYFSGLEVMQDYVLLDENTAWQLFGSYDIEGMQVTIGGIPHVVRGVIRQEKGRMFEAAGGNEATVYVSYDTLSKYGSADELNHYEVVMPNPVKGFARQIVQENMGGEETAMEVVENSTRYRFLPLLGVIADFGTRSMNGKAIIYPYWENIARGYEDILALLLFFEMLFLLFPAIVVIIWLVLLWKHKKWNWKDVKNLAENGIERLRKWRKGRKEKRNHIKEEVE